MEDIIMTEADIDCVDYDNVCQEQPATILTMPNEILAKVTRELPVLWIICLASSCKKMRDLLSFESGNRIWYSALPSSLWALAERYQNEVELGRFLRPKATTGHPGEAHQDRSAGISSPYLSASPLSYSITPSGYAELHQLMLDATLGDLATSIVWPHMSPSLTAASSSVGGSIAGHVSPPKARARVQLLGSAYDRSFDYKREILGHLNSRERCYLCFDNRDSAGGTDLMWRWGLLWCMDCLRAYATSHASIRSVLEAESWLPAMTRQMIYLQTNNRTGYYYLPEIEELTIRLTGISYATCRLNQKRLAFYNAGVRLENSGLEQRRRGLRRQIVEAAQALWEGIDPYPVKVTNTETGEVTLQSRPFLPTQDTFRRFRDRFGPTNALPTLLFPMTDLSEVPTQVAYDPAGGWLEDPTKAVRTGAQFKAISAEWITHKAMLMLCKLIHWRDPDYYRKGQGGFVDNWRNAATTWHIARLESELASGATVGMELVAPHHRKGLQRLKAKLGVALLTSPTRRPQRGIDTSHEAYVEFESLERASRDAERKQAEAIKHFNKIVRATCTKCPETAMLFFPMGFEGLVEHMRIAHPRSFWEGKFHCLG